MRLVKTIYCNFTEIEARINSWVEKTGAHIIQTDTTVAFIPGETSEEGYRIREPRMLTASLITYEMPDEATASKEE